MNKPKQIPHPVLAKATRLTPLQLNSLRCEEKHTVLTPQLMESLAKTPAKPE